MNQKHITTEDRIKIEVYVNEGFSARSIAEKLGFHHSTISRELKRCNSRYNANEACEHQHQLSKRKGRKTVLNEGLKSYIIEKLEEHWSPEQISGRSGCVSFKSIYNWIYNGLIKIPLTVLRRKGKSRKPKETRGKFNIGTSISKRPKSVKNREEFGHWELDTVVSSRGKSKGCMATFAERKTRFYVSIKMPDRSQDSMYDAIEKLLSLFPREVFKTMTSDRGKEFGCYNKVETNYNIDFYFADAYSAWQRGTNENSNGLLREFYPKKTDLTLVKEEDLRSVLKTLNTRPRKCLSFNTPLEEFTRELKLI